MLFLKNIIAADGTKKDHIIKSEKDSELDCKGQLLMLPALIDAHVHFRTPGQEHKENWVSGSRAAIQGGVTTVCDMPNTTPACITKKRLKEKKQMIDQQLKKATIPLRYHLYLGADKHHLDEVLKSSQDAISLKVFMGSSTGDLLMDDPDAIEAAFQAASIAGLPVAVHAENEERLKERAKLYQTEHPSSHSIVRDPQAAAIALEMALSFAKKWNVTLQALHLSTQEEMDLIRKAKKEGISVIAETTPHHLFLDTSAYNTLGTCAQMNPPLRTPEHKEALWKAIHDGTIDTIGSDHAPHTLEEKKKNYPKSPSGVPGVEMILPLLLNAWNEGKLSLEQCVQLTRTNIEKGLKLTPNDDVVLIDPEVRGVIERQHIHSQCGWSPYAKMAIHGLPAYTILKGLPYNLGLYSSAT